MHIQLHKADAPSYWPRLIKVGEDVESSGGYGTERISSQVLVEQKIAMWKAMHVKFQEQVEDYMYSYQASQTASTT